MTEIKFAIFNVQCQDCNFQHLYRTENLDLERKVQFIIRNIHSLPYKHAQKFNHELSTKPCNITTYTCKADLEAAFQLRIRSSQE